MFKQLASRISTFIEERRSRESMEYAQELVRSMNDANPDGRYSIRRCGKDMFFLDSGDEEVARLVPVGENMGSGSSITMGLAFLTDEYPRARFHGADGVSQGPSGPNVFAHTPYGVRNAVEFTSRSKVPALR